MKKVILTIATLLTTIALDAHELCILDLSDNEISYNENNVWVDIYSNINFEADGFIFSHTAPYGDGYYEGFTASRNTDNGNHYDSSGWISNQWGCMAQGGVDLTSDTSDPTAIIGKPFMINYYSAYAASASEYGSSYITIANGAEFTPRSVYVCNSPWGYYGCTEGDGFAQPLVAEGGYYKITFNGVNTTTGVTTSKDFFLAERKYSDRNSDGVINEQDNYTNTSWSLCDLSSLGNVNIIYITMDSSDKGDFGMNTSTIACLDGLQCTTNSSVDKIERDDNNIYTANGNLFVTLHKSQEIHIYNTTGMLVGSYILGAGTHMIDISHMAHGVYFIQHSSGCNKIVL